MRQFFALSRGSRKLVASIGWLLACTGGAHAALQGRDVDGVAANGYEAFYDTVLNITWLADANYAKTSGFDPDGAMSWDLAQIWVGAVSFQGVAGWRLPHFEPVNGVTIQSIPSTVDGSTDASYNIKSSANELAYMYYTNLGLLAPVSPTWQFRDTYGVSTSGIQPVPGLLGGQIKNLASDSYWTNVEYSLDINKAWTFGTKGYFAGYQGTETKTYGHYAWAVHDGDPFKLSVPVVVPGPAPAVDEPASAWLMLAGLGMSTLLMRRRGEIKRQAVALA